MDKMISCDWGTSSFRLRLVKNSDLSILALRHSSQGILTTHALWSAQTASGSQSQGRQRQGDGRRLSFYQAVLREAIRSIEEEHGLSLSGVTVVISGMASSSLGMLELPYKELPFLVDGSDLRIETLYADEFFNHDTLLISGARTGDDVMRGEETQLVGCGAAGMGTGIGASEQVVRWELGDRLQGVGQDPGGEAIFIFPGTHSKHVVVKEGRVVTFKTFMTGEFFELLSKKSILAGDVEDAASVEDGEIAGGAARFKEGVQEGAGGNLLHGSFLVRTNRLLRGVSKDENFHYLSGLLIGAELKELVGVGAPVTVVGEGVLRDHYVAALGILGVKGVRVVDAGEAVVRGQGRIAAAGMRF
jgi:2-dehydro-3-deoxygalactonokinase